MEVLYRRVFMTTKSPEREGRYDTDHGLLLWMNGIWIHPDDPNMHFNTVKYWMEPLKEF